MSRDEFEIQYRELVENANSIILRMDMKGNVTYFNRFAQNFFGYRQEEILGKNVVGTIVAPTDSSGRDLKAMIDDMALHPSSYVSNENENVLRNGSRVWITWTNKSILDEDGRVREILCIGNDITRLKEAEEEIVKAKEADRKSTRLNSSHSGESRMPSSA